MAKQRFSFDDEEIVEEFEEEQEVIPQEKPKRKLNKKKVLMVVGAIALVFVLGFAYIMFAGGNDGPVYGERCAKLLEVDAGKINELKTQMMETNGIKALDIEKDCRIIKFSYEFEEGTSTRNAKNIVEKTLHVFDDGMGYSKDEESAWSELFNKASGRRQYDVELVLKASGNDDFPIFGTKHAGVEDITYTTQAVVDQKSTDKALARQAEVDAANEAAKNGN